MTDKRIIFKGRVNTRADQDIIVYDDGTYVLESWLITGPSYARWMIENEKFYVKHSVYAKYNNPIEDKDWTDWMPCDNSEVRHEVIAEIQFFLELEKKLIE